MKHTSLLTFALTFLSIGSFHLISAKSPNIVLILTDDQGWSQMSDYMDPDLRSSRSTYLETPNMNRLMNEGRRFTSGYSPAPLCTPTRRSILCGTSAPRSGTEFASPSWIPSEHLTIPKALKLANPDYKTAHFGKWGEQMISTPEESGYDLSDGMTGNITGGMPKSLGIESGSHTEGPPHFIDNEDPKRTKTITQRAIGFIKDQVESQKPFYVQVSYYAQHLSVVTSDRMLKKYQDKGPTDRAYPHAWAAMMEELDTGIGQLLDTLADLKITDNTYVFFTTDNGGRGTVPGGDNTKTAPNAPLTGAKHHLYEGGIRVPFMVSGPGIKPGSLNRTPVAGYDFLPTFHALAGGNQKQLSNEIDGVSLVPLFADSTVDSFKRPQEALFFHRPRNGYSAIRQGSYKLMLFWNKDGSIKNLELSKVDKNPTEEGRNIATSQPAMAEALQNKLLGFLYLVNAERVVK
ncbi:MAG: sulfatase [Verrucomicrobia bacterium]|nr:sulfatase [Verrucomicrobiota bacterium]MDA1067281.1 sulfatase [Verrucomicrobiota bacterium]